MATIIIRNLEDSVKTKLRIRAATYNHSMEEEVRIILRTVLEDDEKEKDLGSLIHKRFMKLGGVEYTIPERDQPPRKLSFRE